MRVSGRADRDVKPTSVPEKAATPPAADSLYEVPPEDRTQRLGAGLFFVGALLVLLAPVLPRWIAEGGRPRPLWVATLLLVGMGLWVGGLLAVLKGRRFRGVSPALRYMMLALVILVVPSPSSFSRFRWRSTEASGARCCRTYGVRDIKGGGDEVSREGDGAGRDAEATTTGQPVRTACGVLAVLDMRPKR